MSNINNSIKCTISNCKHFDQSNYCKLNIISVGGNSNCTECTGTECTSFELNK